MRLRFTIPDYKINSNKIFKGAMLAFFCLMFLILLAEYFIDVRSSTLELMVPMTVVTLVTTLLAFRFPDNQILRTIQIALAYVIVEAHFLFNPNIFHAILYWFPFIPLLALILKGMKASQVWLAIILVSHTVNYYLVGNIIGDRYTIPILVDATFVVGIIFILGILATSFLLYTLLGDAFAKMKTSNEELEKLKAKTESKKELLENYQQTLINLSKDTTVFNRGKEELFRRLCSTAANTLKTNRVSIWVVTEENKKMHRQFLYELNNETDEVVTLDRNDYPKYFQALESKPFILANDANVHPDTSEFNEGYLRPLDIYSMLDCPIVIDRKLFGVICCENQHRIKEWNTEDALFIQSLADFIAMSYKNERIRNLLQEVRSQNFDLVEKGNEINAMNEELHALNETLATLNDSLEETVKARTIELETQNKQLTEYAFINSHLLRAPLSRILGLSNLITREVTSVKEAELINALIASTKELDSIIRKISDILYDGNNLSREDIQAIIDRRLHQNE